ncbi:DUF968 domain-containing protein, partial [Shigella boydii]
STLKSPSYTKSVSWQHYPKADDLFVIPLCRKCHSELHAGVKDFEEKHGSQLLLLIRFLMHARNSGVLKWKA